MTREQSQQHQGGIVLENSKPMLPNNQAADWQGSLPAAAPLANPYVPYQSSNPQKYQPPKGLIRGTMFPGLDLPFMGMVNNKEKNKTLTNQLQSLGFAMTELGLDLDTHKDDAEALSLFNAYREMCDELTAEYEKSLGPLTLKEAGENGTWNWTAQPWPWEYAANEEG